MAIQPIQIDFSLVGNYMNAQINQRLVNTTFAATGTQQSQASNSQVQAEQAAGAPPWREEIDSEATLKQALSVLKQLLLKTAIYQRPIMIAQKSG